MRHGRVLLATLLLLLIFPAALFAQASGASLGGRVTDQTEAGLPGVTVTATNTSTGFNRSVVTGSDGGYRFPTLPVGTYTVTADLAGFSSVTARNVELSVATDRELPFTLKQAAVKEQITVTAQAPLIETSPSVGTVVNQRELENLPLNGRQFANLASLAPGTTLSRNTDPTKPGQLTVALNGGSGRNVNYVIDGGDNTDDTIGGALQNFNLEAVQEFKIQTMQYKAEYGRSSGGVLTVVTKTGTNDFLGSAYGFFRDKSLNSKTKGEELANAPKSDYKRKQYGGSLGGPIVRDRAHFFATYEKLNQDKNYLVDTGGIYPNLDGSVVPTPFRDELITGKGTVNLSPVQFLQVRYGYQKNADIYGASSLGPPNSLGTVANKYSSILLGHTWTIGGSKLNEFVYQWTKFDNAITANSTDANLNFPNGVFVGQNPNTPQTTHQKKHQLKDDFSWSSTLGGKRHDFKTGVNYIHEPVLGGDFSTGLAGQYLMLKNDPNSPVTDISINGGFLGFKTPMNEYSFYGQDDWAFNPRLTLNLGLRYDYWTGFDINQANNPIWQALKAQRKYNEGYLKDFQGASDKLSNRTNNWGPRLGFTWDMRGDSQRIIRGGVGRFYDFPYTNATLLFPASAVQSNYGVVYSNTNPTGIKNPDGSFFHPGQPLPPNQLPSAAVPPPNEVASPTITKVPFSDQISAGYSWQVNPWLGLNLEAVGAWYKNIPFRFRGNPTLDQNGQPYLNADGTPRRRFTDFGQGGNFRIWEGGGKANYKGVNVGFHARMSQKLDMQGFYTFSRAQGNILTGADEFRLTGSDFQPDMHRLGRDASINPLNPWCSACTGPLFSDSTHRVTVALVYQAPFEINVSGIARYRSGFPYTVINPDALDLNGDSYRIDLAPGVSHVNSKRAKGWNQIDVRAGKVFRFAGRYSVEPIAEIFNLLNANNPVKYDRLGVPHSYAGDPGQGEQRLAQLGLRVTF
jgi:outer membrane receptor protein involved in Fe transport